MSEKSPPDETKKVKNFLAQLPLFPWPKDKLKSATLPPPLPVRSQQQNKPGSMAAKKPSKGQPLSPTSPVPCTNCESGKECTLHQYEELSTIGRYSVERNNYEPLTVTTENDGSCDLNSRLRKIEDNQARIRNEFNDFRNTVSNKLNSLDSSIKRLIEMGDELDESMRDSFALVHSTMEKMHTQLLESSDHLGKQILDIRRDMVNQGAHQTQPKMAESGQKRQTHFFEWEVGSFDNLVKHQQISTSQSYLIAQIDFKLLGEATCTRDGRLSVKVTGEFMHSPIDPSERRNFECSAYLIDKTGKQPNWFVGRINADFNKGKEWSIGHVPVCDVQTKGYYSQEGSVNLKFIVDVFV